MVYLPAMTETSHAGRVRIGELARRTGVTPELLRAWEQRYGLLEPARSAGGFRLYSSADEQRVRAMTGLMRSGLSAAEAAARSRAGEIETDAGVEVAADAPIVDQLAAELRAALDRFDAVEAHAGLDRLFGAVSLESAIAQVLVPYLHELGERWERGEVSVAQEHFASNLVRGRLLGLARDWANGSGALYVLACPPGEEHDLGLIMFGLAFARRGGRVVFLGADTPVGMIADTAAGTGAAGVVVAVSRVEVLEISLHELRALAGRTAMFICGRGATPMVVNAIGARLLEGDPVKAAGALA
jgi:DNA-binding transcriptional MerR regulator